MAVFFVSEQPEELRGHEYHRDDQHDWMEFRTDEGERYAVAGLTVYHEKATAWMFWRILKPSIKAWKDLRKQVCPSLVLMVRGLEVVRVCVASYDKTDVDFEKMVGFMGFTVLPAGDSAEPWPKIGVLEV